jgi:hypothetical protein
VSFKMHSMLISAFSRSRWALCPTWTRLSSSCVDELFFITAVWKMKGFCGRNSRRLCPSMQIRSIYQAYRMKSNFIVIQRHYQCISAVLIAPPLPERGACRRQEAWPWQQ